MSLPRVKINRSLHTLCLGSYFLFSVGQVWLDINTSTEPDLYLRITQHTAAWVSSHVVLMLATLLVFPATVIVVRGLQKSRAL